MAVTTHVVLDTSCIVALVSSWHVRHHEVLRIVEDHLADGMRLGLAAHSVVEAYSVLTRLPAPHRLAPKDAWTLLQGNFETIATLKTLTPKEHWALIRSAADDDIAGGRCYDALIARSASKLTPCVFLTLNARHFAQWDRDQMTIREP